MDISDERSASGDEAVRVLVRLAVGAEAAEALRFLAEGQDFRVYTAGSLALRVPKRAECARRLSTEVALLDALAPALLPVRVPRPRRRDAAKIGKALPFIAYDLIPGIQGDRIDPAAHPDLAPALGRFLGALHRFPVDVAEALGVPDHRGLDSVATTLERLRTEAAGEPAWPDGLDARLATACATFLASPPAALPAEAPGPGCLIHADLGAEHVLVDEATGALAGVIDWADACIADPARDLAGLWAWGGAAFLERLLAAYGPPLDPGARARVAFLGRAFALDDWVDGRADDEARREFSRRQLARVFL